MDYPMKRLILTVLATLPLVRCFGNEWVRYCKRGNAQALRSADCDALGRGGMWSCLRMTQHDPAIAAAVVRCPRILPRGQRFCRTVHRLYVAEMPLAFRAMLAHGQCRRLGQRRIGRILGSIVYSTSPNAERFARALIEKCHIQPSTWRKFIQQAKINNRQDILLFARQVRRVQEQHKRHFRRDPRGGKPRTQKEQQIATLPSGEAIKIDKKVTSFDPSDPAAHDTDQSRARAHSINRHHRHHRHGRHRPHHDALDDYDGPFSHHHARRRGHGRPHHKRYSPGHRHPHTHKKSHRHRHRHRHHRPHPRDSLQVGKYRGKVTRIGPHKVKSDLTILARITPKQAHHFGLLSNGCLALNEAHFRQPGVSSDVVGNLPLHCFRQIPPPAFAGLSAQMVAKVRWWPFVTRDQIRKIRAGDAIRAVPFDQLGMGRQRDREDREHPCWTITRDQLRAIRKSPRANAEYKRRCIRSAAPPSVTVSCSMVLAMGLVTCAALFF